MKFDGLDLHFTASDLIFPAILLVGFAISVTLGVWIWRSRWREHQSVTKGEDERKGKK